MKNNKLTILTWFLLLSSLVYFSPWWFAAPSHWRMVSLASVFLATSLLVLNYNLKNFGNFFRKDVCSQISPFTGDAKLVDDTLHWHSTFKRRTFFFLAVAIAYFVAAVLAGPKLTEVSQLYLYIVGWGVLCLFLNEQIRTYILVSALMNELDLEIKTSNSDCNDGDCKKVIRF